MPGQTAPLRLGISGAAGRMGRMLIQQIAAHADLALAAATVRPGTLFVGSDAGEAAGAVNLGVTISDSFAAAGADFDCLVDFTLPDAVPAHLAYCRERGVPLVLGVTGLPQALQVEVDAAARAVPVLQAANFSVGVNLMLALLGMATAGFGEEADVEIVEAHHRGKRDAPSGTALAMGEAVAAVRGARLEDLASTDRAAHAGAARRPGSIGFASLRAGDIVGEHTALFAIDGERLEIGHRATSRTVFASGALRAARWLAQDRAPGLYGMRDVLGLPSA